jgi:hypothetical protein
MACFTWAEQPNPGIYNIVFDAEWSTVGIGDHPGIPADNSFALSPNPANDFVNVRICKAGDYTLTVTSVVGQEVLTTAIQGTEYKLSLVNIPRGMYMVRITGNGIDTMKKLIVN